MPANQSDDQAMADLLHDAFERERRHQWRPRWPMELDTVMTHVFRCVCCEGIRPNEERQEPRSEVCLRCVQAAGLCL
jgi:hypothetical protein